MHDDQQHNKHDHDHRHDPHGGRKRLKNGDGLGGAHQAKRLRVGKQQTDRHKDGAHTVGDEQDLRLCHGAAAGEDHAVEITQRRTEQQRDYDGADLTQRVNERNSHNSGQREDTGNGEVDEAADDDKGHAKRDKRQRTQLTQDVGQI